MKILIWTKDEESGDLVPVKIEDVEEVTVARQGTIRMEAHGDTINITEKPA